MASNLVIKGAEELDKALKELGRKVEARVVRRAIRRAATVMRGAIKAKVPRRTEPGFKDSRGLSAGLRIKGKGYLNRRPGFARSQIKVSPRRGRRGVFRVAVHNSQAYYLAFLERGTKHISPRPIFRSTLHSKGQAVVDRAMAEMRSGVEAEARKARGT